MEIIYADEWVAVVKKSFGEVSEEAGADSVPGLVRGTLGGEVYVVHRLDRTTEGLMVLAREKEAAAELSRQVREGEVRKEYLAAAHGRVPEEGEMRDWLYYDRGKGRAFVVKGERRGVKEALLRFRREEVVSTRWGEVSLVGVTLLTGRTHQIRAQFGARGTPLLGDGKYGDRANYKGCALVSRELDFLHPVKGERMRFRLELRGGSGGA